MTFIPMNKRRMTNTFCVLAGTAQDIAEIMTHYGRGAVVAVAQHKDDDREVPGEYYCVRLSGTTGLRDVLVKVLGHGPGAVEEVEEVIIRDYS